MAHLVSHARRPPAIFCVVLGMIAWDRLEEVLIQWVWNRASSFEQSLLGVIDALLAKDSLLPGVRPARARISHKCLFVRGVFGDAGTSWLAKTAPEASPV